MLSNKTQKTEVDIVYKYKSDYNTEHYNNLSCKQICLLASDVIQNKTNNEAFTNFIKLTCHEYEKNTCDKERWDTFIKLQSIKEY